MDKNMDKVLAAWPELPEHIRKAIMLLAAPGGGHGSGQQKSM
jgi:hypothetical protein